METPQKKQFCTGLKRCLKARHCFGVECRKSNNSGAQHMWSGFLKSGFCGNRSLTQSGIDMAIKLLAHTCAENIAVLFVVPKKQRARDFPFITRGISHGTPQPNTSVWRLKVRLNKLCNLPLMRGCSTSVYDISRIFIV